MKVFNMHKMCFCCVCSTRKVDTRNAYVRRMGFFVVTSSCQKIGNDILTVASTHSAVPARVRVPCVVYTIETQGASINFAWL